MKESIRAQRQVCSPQPITEPSNYQEAAQKSIHAPIVECLDEERDDEGKDANNKDADSNYLSSQTPNNKGECQQPPEDVDSNDISPGINEEFLLRPAPQHQYDA